MAIILDIIILGFIIISGFIGYKKGLASIAINIIGIILALVLAFALKGSVASFILEKTSISSSLKTTISDGINSAIKNKIGSSEEESKTEPLDNVTGETQEAEKDNATEQQSSNKEVSSFYTSLVEKMNVESGVDALADKVVKFILETASFILIFIAVYLCVFIIKMMLNVVCKLPILTQINGIGGLVASTVISIIQVWVVLAILSFLAPIMPGVLNIIETTYVTKLLYNINLIVLVLSSGLKF